VQKVLSTVFRTGQRFGAAHIVGVLLGDNSERLRSLGHDQLSVFGIGSELDRNQWRAVIRQLQSRDVLVSPAEARGGLSFGADALVRPLLRGEEPVELALPDPTPSGRRSRRPTSGTTAAGTGAAIDPGDPLLAALKAWRLAQAREQGVPPYVVFHDRTLLELTGQRPLTLEQLSAVGGIGRAKLERYGEALLQVLTDRDL